MESDKQKSADETGIRAQINREERSRGGEREMERGRERQ